MSTVKYLLAILLGIAVAACGGGGGGSSTPAAPVTPPATYTISGTVSGSVSSGVAISLGGDQLATATTDASGNYSFAGLANGNYTVAPTKSGNAFTPASKAVKVSGTNVPNTNFVALINTTGTFSISGAVSGAGSGVTISLGGAGSTLTGSGGLYTMPGLVPATYILTPSLPGYTFNPVSSAPVNLGSTNVTGVNFTAMLAPVSYSISGTVSGAPAGVQITVTGTANPPPVTTAAGGAYTVSGLANGSYTVAPSLSGYSFSPNQTTVNVNGANVANTNFSGASNPAVTTTVHGTVTGSWIQGVTVTMSGGASGTATTDAGGNFSFANLPSGASYTFAASLSGYTISNSPQTSTIPTGSSTPVTLVNMVASSSVTSASISGTITYGGSQAGPVYILAYQSGCPACGSVAGTYATLTSSSGSYSGTYTIRGLPARTYNVVAVMDALGSGQPNATDPSVTLTSVSAPSSGVPIVLPPPPSPTAAPAAPSIASVTPGNGSVFILYTPPVDSSGNETATGYYLSWGTDTGASNGGTKFFSANGTNNAFYLLRGLTNGVGLNFKMNAVVNGITTPSAWYVFPATVIVGAPTNNLNVTGTINFTGIATGPLLVTVHNARGVYYTTIGSTANPPASPVTYNVTGVPSGSYQISAVIDNNNDGQLDIGDYTYGFGANSPLFTVVNATFTQNITFPTTNATAAVQTQYSGSSGLSDISLGMDDGLKHVVNVTLMSGPKVAVPLDIGVNSNGGTTPVLTYSGAPAVNDSYGFLVTYSDGTTQTITGNVTGVLGSADLATSLTATPTPSRNQPTFSWTAPGTTPAFYTVQGLTGNNITVPGSLISVDLSKYGITLTTGTTYNWQVATQDANGNSAVATAPAPGYTP